MTKSQKLNQIDQNDFASDEGGAISIMNLFFVVALAMLTGIAIDVSNLIQARTQLQVAADTAAHAALYKRDDDSLTKDEAKDEAIRIAQAIMPTGRYGNVLTADHIKFGSWDRSSEEFIVDDSRRDAVYVKASRLSEDNNAVASFLLQLVGFSEWDVVTPVVFETYRPTCLREGIVADDVVDIQSNNSFVNGFCIHSNEYFSVNQNNLFEEGTIVSMPNIEDIDLPSSGYTKNEGLQAALREGRRRIRIIDQLDEIRDGMTNPDSRYYRDFLLSPIPIMQTLTQNNNNIATTDLTSGRVHNLTCDKPNGEITFAGEVFTDIVIITNCDTKMSNGTAFENATLIITSESDDTVSTPNGFRLGKDDGCLDGGGAQLISYGSIKGASALELYGGQILAAGDVEFTAQNDGIEGASIVAGGTVSITSGSTMGFCGTGMEHVFQAEYFRMAY